MSECPTIDLNSQSNAVYGDEVFLGFDFFYFFAGANVFWSGRDPYLQCNYESQLIAQGWQSTYELLLFPYPPNFLFVLFPIVNFRFENALILWYLTLLGAILFEIATGQPPHSGGDPALCEDVFAFEDWDVLLDRLGGSVKV